MRALAGVDHRAWLQSGRGLVPLVFAVVHSSALASEPSSLLRAGLPLVPRQRACPSLRVRCRSIARAMREAHARNPRLRHSAAGQKKRCGYCGQEGHNRRACPQLLAAAQSAGEGQRAAEQETAARKAGRQAQPAGAAADAHADDVIAEAVPQAANPPAPSRVIVIEEVDGSPLPSADPAAAPDPAAAAAQLDAAAGQAASSGGLATGSQEGSLRSPVGAALPGRALPTLAMGPGMSLCPEGSWVFSLPQSKEECVAQAAQVRGKTPRPAQRCRGSQAVPPSPSCVLPAPVPTTAPSPPPWCAPQACLRAWDDGIRRQALELLLPQAHPTEDGGWPGGIRQQFRCGAGVRPPWAPGRDGCTAGRACTRAPTGRPLQPPPEQPAADGAPNTAPGRAPPTLSHPLAFHRQGGQAHGGGAAAEAEGARGAGGAHHGRAAGRGRLRG